MCKSKARRQSPPRRAPQKSPSLEIECLLSQKLMCTLSALFETKNRVENVPLVLELVLPPLRKCRRHLCRKVQTGRPHFSACPLPPPCSQAPSCTFGFSPSLCKQRVSLCTCLFTHLWDFPCRISSRKGKRWAGGHNPCPFYIDTNSPSTSVARGRLCTPSATVLSAGPALRRAGTSGRFVRSWPVLPAGPAPGSLHTQRPPFGNSSSALRFLFAGF